jgi:hypothetical protein
LTLGFKLGVGAKFNSVSNQLSQEDADRRMTGDWNNPANWIQKKGNHIIPKFNFGFYVGFRFR